MQQSSPSAETEALLARLSQRPGVQSTLILSRSTGAIVRSSGLITAEDLEQDDTAAAAPPTTNSGETNGADGNDAATPGRKARATPRTSVGALVEELNGGNDEARLLRVRTKRNEIVVVPDAKFLAVVIHDTPPA
ncbi:hypothetical protein B0A55_01581 [Friedmanniomyces simplex]|uniref:Roadblock/LAMTOR2 domain-containing protein n=1 Tax=Friedmanniomyces simplex TaxID=329884 RepID=A0A4U0Y1E9_9PEZI|nr:hypothetical protein B0A55_01581 [Friedmanniomyces simplex]